MQFSSLKSLTIFLCPEDKIQTLTLLLDPTWLMAPIPLLNEFTGLPKISLTLPQSLWQLISSLKVSSLISASEIILNDSSSFKVNAISWEKDSLMLQSKLGPLTRSYTLFTKVCGYLCAVHCSREECVSSITDSSLRKRSGFLSSPPRGACRPVADI